MKALLLAALLTGCSALPLCLFGSDVPAENVICAYKNFGVEGSEMILRAENEAALEHDGGNCAAHVRAVSERLRPYGYVVSELITPPNHVSALVTDPVTGAQFVVDNGHLIPIATFGGVATLDEFKAEWRMP